MTGRQQAVCVLLLGILLFFTAAIRAQPVSPGGDLPAVARALGAALRPPGGTPPTLLPTRVPPGNPTTPSPNRTPPRAAHVLGLSLEAGTGRIVSMAAPAASVFAADPRVAEVRPASPTSLFVLGVAPGRTTIAAI